MRLECGADPDKQEELTEVTARQMEALYHPEILAVFRKTPVRLPLADTPPAISDETKEWNRREEKLKCQEKS